MCIRDRACQIEITFDAEDDVVDLIVVTSGHADFAAISRVEVVFASAIEMAKAVARVHAEIKARPGEELSLIHI